MANSLMIFLMLCVFAQCQSQSNMKESNHKYTNELINETSPYLLQHAHNPVNWYAWNDETLRKAKSENKMLLISIGYSACHWCHVMEHESFEDEEVAKIMNENFICIKVDREERPDVDRIYLDAVQMIQGNGGWPLNCFALPDGRPVWGGTYFRKEQWKKVLQSIATHYKKKPEELIAQAEEITSGIKSSDLTFIKDEKEAITKDDLDNMVHNFVAGFDRTNGGRTGAPKFPVPNNYLFLLRYAALVNNEEVLSQVELTLQKMAAGGIYDQIGGGFARYSVDAHWHVPHFEKMLYDNAQLVSLYSEAFQMTGNKEYENVVKETLEFIRREMTNPEGAFYSSLDADSEGEEGKFYVWTKSEIEEVAGDDSKIINDYFGIDGPAYWEDEKNVLVKDKTIDELSQKYNKPANEVEEIIERAKEKLLKKRAERIRPSLDDKILTSWNALMIKGYIDAYMVFGKKDYLETAIKNAGFIFHKMKKSDGGLFHNYKNGRSTIPGFLEDYSFVIDATISLYEATFDEKWINEAKRLTDYVILHFYDEQSGMFFFTPDENTNLIARKMEITDNVIPSSNSVIAKSLFLLSHIFEEKKYKNIADKMLNNIKGKMISYPSSFSNWGILALYKVYPFYSVVIYGKESRARLMEMSKYYLPNIIKSGSVTKSELPLFENRFVENKTMIYVCTEKGCKLPVEKVEDALKQGLARR